MTTTKTKQQIKTEWLEALRSGAYKQTGGTMKRRLENGYRGYCCLGVLCEAVLGELIVTETWESTFQGATSLYEAAESVWTRDLNRQVIQMNDEDMTFIQIADFIEENWVLDDNK